MLVFTTRNAAVHRSIEHGTSAPAEQRGRRRPSSEPYPEITANRWRTRIALRARRPLAGVTASDVRAHRHRLCVYAASRRVIEGSEPRDGHWKAITPSPRGAQRASPNDSRKGSNSRALTALLESWVNDSCDWAVPTGTRSRANKAPRGAGEQQTNRAQREWCPVLRSKFSGCHWRRRRAETLTRRDHTHRGSRKKRSTTILTSPDERK